jgi:RND family efflux transporter MFP subunit
MRFCASTSQIFGSKRVASAGSVAAMKHYALALASLFLTASVRAEVPGYTEPYKTITLSCAESGVIAEMLVEEGARVKKNQVLAKLDTAQHEAELDIAKTNTDLQKSKVSKLEEIVRSSRISQDELDRARTDLKVRQAEVRKIQAVIENRIMRSPVDGIVSEIKRDPSEAVSLSSPHVLTVVQIDRLLVNLFLTPSRAAQMKVGEKLKLTLGKNAQPAVATVEFVSPVTDAASGTVRVKFVLHFSIRQRLPSHELDRLLHPLVVRGCFE